MRFTITLIVLGLVAGGLLASKPMLADDEQKTEKKGRRLFAALARA